MERVFARLFNIPVEVKAKEAKTYIWSMAEALIPKGEARRFNQAVMELGALICVPRNPICPDCPLQAPCESHRLGITDQRPVPGKSKGLIPIDVAVGVLVHEGKVFIQKRPASGLMPHLWEFPGGKLREGETPSQALAREYREELELDVLCLHKIVLIRHNYTSFKVALHAYFCKLSEEKQTPVLHAAVEGRWVAPEDLDVYAFPAANRRLITLVRKSLDFPR